MLLLLLVKKCVLACMCVIPSLIVVVNKGG